MSVSIDFTGKVAMVSGAARGIGAASAKAFAEAGARVVVTDILPEVEEIVAEIRQAGGEAVALVTDISKSENCKAVVDLAISSYGRLDFAFNNAGIGGKPAPAGEVKKEDWLRVININLNSVFYCIKYQLPEMVKTGGGVIINNSSICGVRPLPDSSLEYTAAKHGVIGLTRQIAVNHGAEGIRSLAVCPGYIETPLTDADKGGDIDEAAKQWFLRRIPQGRFGQPEDIAKAVRMLCSEDACYVNGAYLQVDGGLLQG